MTGVIDSLKRLERAGAEDSRATQRLVEAAETLGRHIAAGLPEEVNTGECGEGLPRGYVAERRVCLNRALAAPQVRELVVWDHDGDCWSTVQSSRQAALDFARDIATGWLSELAEWLEARTAEAEQAAGTIEAAKPESTESYDVYLCLAETAHGKRFWLTSRDCQASVSPEELKHALGPATVGPDGYPDEQAAAEALAETEQRTTFTSDFPGISISADGWEYI